MKKYQLIFTAWTDHFSTIKPFSPEFHVYFWYFSRRKMRKADSTDHKRENVEVPFKKKRMFDL